MLRGLTWWARVVKLTMDSRAFARFEALVSSSASRLRRLWCRVLRANATKCCSAHDWRSRRTKPRQSRLRSESPSSSPPHGSGTCGRLRSRRFFRAPRVPASSQPCGAPPHRTFYPSGYHDARQVRLVVAPWSPPASSAGSVRGCRTGSYYGRGPAHAREVRVATRPRALDDGRRATPLKRRTRVAIFARHET